MPSKIAAWFAATTLAAGLLSCGPSEEEKMLAQFEQDLRTANAAIDSLEYTVESSNLLIDQLRAQVDSTQTVNEDLLASIQKLNGEVREWRQLATQYKESNQRLNTEIQRLRQEKEVDRQTIGRLRAQADSLGGELMDAHSSIRRQSDRIREMETELAQTRDQVSHLEQVQASVTFYVATERYLEEQGILEAGRPFGRAFRKEYRLVRKLDRQDANTRLAAIGDPVPVGGNVEAVADRYGRLKEGVDYRLRKENGERTLTFANPMLAGAEVVAVLSQ
ncbi:MAG: hypothetical protein AB1505_12410 [Candidatus Latescibacterota bacterium]